MSNTINNIFDEQTFKYSNKHIKLNLKITFEKALYDYFKQLYSYQMKLSISNIFVMNVYSKIFKNNHMRPNTVTKIIFKNQLVLHV